MPRESERRRKIEAARARGRQHRAVDRIDKLGLDAGAARPAAAEIAFQLFRSGHCTLTRAKLNYIAIKVGRNAEPTAWTGHDGSIAAEADCLLTGGRPPSLCGAQRCGNNG